jgi:predicted metal-binding protein
MPMNYGDGVEIYSNSINPGGPVFNEPAPVSNKPAAAFISAASDSTPLIAIRTCEGCHGLESLHNIQADSDGDDEITVGGELPGYGHVGADNPGGDSDCWGCHGFGFGSSSAPGAGPVTPFIASSNISVMTAGTDTEVILTGSAFTNVAGTTQWISNVVLTAADGSSIELTPDAISEGSLTVTFPGTITAGNYEVRAVKGDTKSNPVVISIKPAVVISSTRCGGCTGVVTINGSGFGDAPPEGAEEYLNVMADGLFVGTIISWTDTQIQVEGGCSYDFLTVNALMGSATK